ncbi:putative transcription factor iiic-like protein [Rosellinia necatrix]|uniref:Putative transcription factor iiic-like protein n=1 Tax=Rosellinia necatrix TaxID=77044 RepID=A0A1W2TNT2_ROSNE|nr:putative transcription factor iiic-like protein [Rosellinia necatrix]
MAPKKQKSQTRLTFEPTGAYSSSPVSAYTPARVRYSGNAHSSPARRLSSAATPSSSSQPARRSSRHTSKQSKLDSSIAPPASFMPKLHDGRNLVVEGDTSDDSAAEIDDAGYDEDDNVDLLPSTQKAVKPHKSGATDSPDSDEEPIIKNLRSSQSVSTRLQRAVIIDGDSDDEEPERPRLFSPRKRRRPSIISLDDDSDDAPILPPQSARKLSRPKFVELDDSDEDVISPLKRRKTFHRSSPTASTADRPLKKLRRPSQAASSPIKKTHKGHRSEKQKKMELLRRRRAGEKIDRLTESESSSGEDGKRGIYDSDSEGGLEVLKEFEDEEQDEEVEEQPVPRKNKPRKDREKKMDPADGREEEEGDLDDFVTDDDDAPLGAPVDIPLEFTSHAHKPLKDQFPFAVEWLVHNRINPAFERRDPVYVNAWRRLDDEVSGLANSKFTSSAWKPDFHRALKSRPILESYSLVGGTGLHETCEACGRSGHPSTFKIIFSGPAYHKDTLAEVESEDSASNEDGDAAEEDEEDDETASVDTRGMPLPPAGKEWHVGAVCCSNAETAHGLLHWKHALKQWVEDRLEADGWMTGARLRERERMRAGRRRALANDIVDRWQENRVVNALYADFRNTLENARNKATSGRGLRRFGR